MPIDFKEYPIYTTKVNDKLDIMSIVANHEILEFMNKRDIDGFSKRLYDLGSRNYDFMSAASQAYTGENAKVLKLIAEQFTQMFYEKRIDSVPYESIRINYLSNDAEYFFDVLNYYLRPVTDPTRFNAIEYSEKFLDGKFNKRFAVAYVAGIIHPRAFFNTRKTNAAEILNKTFGEDSATDEDKFRLSRLSLEKASPELQEAYQFFVKNKRGEIIEGFDIVGKWFDSLQDFSTTPDVLKIPDISESTDVDAKNVLNLLKTRLNSNQVIAAMRHFVQYMEIKSLPDRNARNWLKKSIEIFTTFFDGTVDDFDVVMKFLVNDHSTELSRKMVEKNISKYQFIAEETHTNLVKFLYAPFPNVNISFESIVAVLKMFIDLNNTGEMEFKNENFYDLVRRAIGRTKNIHIVPFINLKLDIFKTIINDTDSGIYTKFEREYYQWLVDNNSEINKYLVNLYETLTPDECISRNTLSVEFLRTNDTTDKIIDNFKNAVWPIVTASTIVNELPKYQKNEKIITALKEFLSSISLDNYKDDLFWYKKYQTLKLMIATGKEFNEIALNMMNNKSKNNYASKIGTEIFGVLSYSVSYITKFFELISNQDILENIDKEVFTDIMKLVSSGIDHMNLFEFGRKVKNVDETKIDYFLENCTDEYGKKEFLQYIMGADIGMIAGKEIFRDDVPIKPYEKLTEARLGEILKYNKISPSKYMMGKVSTITDVNKLLTTFSKKIIDIKAKEIKADQEYLERKTIEYDTFNKYKHGNIAPKILREFAVNIPEQIKAFDKFVSLFPTSSIIQPVFHGTGSVGASMILRYGFAIIKQGDPAVTGRMLGDGIYFSTVIDKVAQYVADSGYSRGIGNKGYIFEMKAALGTVFTHYRSDGTEPNSRILSPEWCVYHPEKQLQIYKAFEVELVSKTAIDELKQKYQINEAIVEIKTFKEYLRESTDENYANATTYTFMDGTIPIDKITAVDFERFDPISFGLHVRLEGSQIGPMLTIEHNGPQSQAFCVRNTAAFMEQPEFKQYIQLINNLSDDIGPRG